MSGLALIGGLAGIASAVLFAAISTGSPSGVLLFYLATLPLFIAGLGWGWMTPVVGAVVGGLAILITLNGPSALVFALSVALPAAWICYLAQMSRTGDQGDVEWYPIGRLTLWMAGIGGTIVSVTILMMGSSMESYREGLTVIMAELTGGGTPLSEEELAGFVDTIIAILPPASAGLWFIVTLLNLYFAARIVRASGRLTRPWPDLSAISTPTGLALVTGITAALALLGGMFGSVGSAFAAVLIIVHGLVGLGVIHVLTRGAGMRGLTLTVVYASIVMFLWPLMLIALLGALETRINLRARKSGGPPPPQPPPGTSPPSGRPD